MHQLIERPRVNDPERKLGPELDSLARWMDSAFEIPGTGVRFGLDAIIGLIPGIGDTVTSFVSLYILHAASRYGVARVTLLRMAMNIGIDWLFGAIPLVGDAFDVYWKANLKNVALLRRHVLATAPEQRRVRRGDWLVVAGLSVALLALLAGALMIAYFLVTWLAGLLLNRHQ